MIDAAAFRALSYGLYVVASRSGEKQAGCIANTFQQVTSTPPQVSVTLNKDNVTTSVIQESGYYTVSCLSEDATMELIGTFGFKSSDDIDKFAECENDSCDIGLPYVTEQSVAWFKVKVTQTVDLGTHVMFIGEVEQAEVLAKATPMTYAFYHQVKGGKTPPKASSYTDNLEDTATPSTKNAEGASSERIGWRCTLCGYVVEMDELPDDFTCPICGVGKEFFEKIELD